MVLARGLGQPGFFAQSTAASPQRNWALIHTSQAHSRATAPATYCFWLVLLASQAYKANGGVCAWELLYRCAQ